MLFTNILHTYYFKILLYSFEYIDSITYSYSRSGLLNIEHFMAWWNYAGKSCKLDARPSKHIQELCMALHSESVPTSDLQP